MSTYTEAKTATPVATGSSASVTVSKNIALKEHLDEDVNYRALTIKGTGRPVIVSTKTDGNPVVVYTRTNSNPVVFHHGEQIRLPYSMVFVNPSETVEKTNGLTSTWLFGKSYADTCTPVAAPSSASVTISQSISTSDASLSTEFNTTVA